MLEPPQVGTTPAEYARTQGRTKLSAALDDHASTASFLASQLSDLFITLHIFNKLSAAVA
jgi:hypothetical protein